VLIAIVLLAHFVPPERSAPSPDDLSTALQIRSNGLAQFLRSVALAPQRPLTHVLLVLETAWTREEPWRGTLLLAGMAVLVCLVAHALFRELLRNDDLAFVATITYALLPNKLELYHTSMYAVLMVMHLMQMGAALLFLRALRLGSPVSLIAALMAYVAGCLMTETAVFLPLALAGWATALRLPRIRWVYWFAAPFLMITVLYLTALGQPPLLGGTRVIQWARIPYNVFVVAPQFFFGRFMARAVLYGVTQFRYMETPWLAVALCLDALALVAAWRWISRTPLPVPSTRLLYASAAATALLLIPNMLYFIEDRHVALADLGFALLLLPLAGLGRRVPAAAAMALTSLLAVAQGNAWNHVVACRINDALQRAVDERSSEVASARVVVFDLASFMNRIPYTWGERGHNPLATYYGAQVFAPWGLSSVVGLAGGRGRVIASPVPVVRRGDSWEFAGWGSSGTLQHAPVAGTLVIGYRDVYPCGFDAGKRKACP
jgi:hypothetical protein